MNDKILKLCKLMMMYIIKDQLNYERFCKEADKIFAEDLTDEVDKVLGLRKQWPK